MKHTGKILFVCVENAGRSQMAEAFANQWGIPALGPRKDPKCHIQSTLIHLGLSFPSSC
jgi:protein-tyrosine-phosphatase